MDDDEEDEDDDDEEDDADEDEDVLLLLLLRNVLRSNHVMDTSAFPLARRPITLPPATAMRGGSAGSRIKWPVG